MQANNSIKVDGKKNEGGIKRIQEILIMVSEVKNERRKCRQTINYVTSGQSG